MKTKLAKFRWSTYAPMIAISIISSIYIGLTAFSIISTQLQSTLLLPTVSLLAIAVWELFKQTLQTQERRLELRQQNAFSLSATSHMADTAFDRHVAFCEEYASALIVCLRTLHQEGPTVIALDIANSLYNIRTKYILWETKKIEIMLDKFEVALRSLGADEYSLKSIPVGDERSKLIKTIYSNFRQILSIEKLPENPDSEVAVTYIVDGLRDLLGIKQLSELRAYHIDLASQDSK